MGFFFEKKESKEKLKIKARPQVKQSSKESLNRLGCKACPLNKGNNRSPKMLPDLGDSLNGVYFLGGGPSEQDDKINTPFGDKAGNLLRAMCGSLDGVSFDNVIRDFSASANHGSVQYLVALECCRSLVTKSIEEAKPRLIVGLGIYALKWMLDTIDMVGLRGRLFAVTVGTHKCWFLPTYDPQFIIDNAFEGSDPLRSRLGHCLKFDLVKALDYASSLNVPIIDTPQAIRAGVQAFNGYGQGQLANLLRLISAARKAPEKAIDLETSHLRPYAVNARILTAAISFENVDISFAIDHPKSGWKPADKLAIKKAIRSLLTDDTTIIAHNVIFECEWFISWLGTDCIRHDNWECTMMQAHVLDERRGSQGRGDDEYGPNPYQALEFLVKQNFGLAFKSHFKVDRKNMVDSDLDETLSYGAADTRYTLRLFHLQTERLRKSSLLHTYQEAKSRQPTVALMQHAGIPIDATCNKRMQKKLEAEIKEIEGKISDLPEVKAYVAKWKSFNPASSPELIKLLKLNYRVKEEALKGDDGKISTDKNTLTRLNLPISKLIEDHRNRSKLKSTYVDPFELGKGEFIHPDGRMHPNFNTTFTESFRLSSSQPNQQNWSNRSDKWVREQVVAEPGHVLVAFDYGQLEACTAAMCTKDKVLVKALWDDYDIHQFWAEKTASIYPKIIGGKELMADKAVMKKLRSLVKNKLVFPAMFGAQNTSIAGYLGMPIEPINKLMDEFWDTFKGIYNWQKATMANYYEYGYVEDPMGRRRNYPLTKNQAINFPIQCLGAGIVCRAMVRLSKRAQESGDAYFQPRMNIHDDLCMSIPDNDKILEEAIKTIYSILLSPGFDFVNVPLSVECTIGQDWAHMGSIGKFWSHRDL